MENENEVVVNGQKKETKGFSIASLVLGIVGIFIFAIPCGILAIIFGIIGRKKGGKGMALAGLILGIIDVSMVTIAYIKSIGFLATIFTNLL